jgi:C-terminal processing protease CtpA/Prc
MKPERMKRHLPLVLMTILQLSSNGSWAAGAEPELKPDIPKLDLSNKPKTPLKGGVQHNAVLKPDKPKSLNAKLGTDNGNTLKGKTADNNKDTLKGKAGDNGDANLAKRQAKLDREKKQDALDAELTSGIGIIGIKFMMTFGRPPVINRVFPGTPASDKGLLPNDIILAVDGVPTFGLSQAEVYNMIIGTPNTPVTLSLRRNSDFSSCRMNRMDFNDIKDPRVRRDYQNM